MWNLNGFVPKPVTSLRLSVALACVFGASACGPSGGLIDYTIEFTLSDSPEDLALLKFRVAYTSGDFVGGGAGVSCDLLATDDSETADFDDDDNGTLDIDIDATDLPLSPVIAIVECQFSANTQPTSANFTITVQSAEDDAGDPVATADVDVVVTSTDPS